MKKLIIFLFAIFLFASNFLLSQEPLPDTVWTKKMEGEIHDVKISPDGNQIATISGSKVVLLESNNGSIVKEFDLSPSGAYNLEYSRSGDTILVCGAKNKLYLIDTKQLKIIYTFVFDNVSYFYSKFIDNDRKILAVVMRDTMITMPYWEFIFKFDAYNIKTKTLEHSIEIKKMMDNITFSPDDSLIAFSTFSPFSSGKTNVVEILDAKTLTKKVDLGEHSEVVTDMTFSPDGKMLASASWDGTVKIWDVKNKRLLNTIINQYTPCFISVIFSKDSKYLILGEGGDLNTKMQIYDIIDRKFIYRFPYRCNGSRIDISNDNKYFVASGYVKIFLFNARWNFTGIEEETQKEPLLYPNPTSNIVNIIFNNNYSSFVKIELSNINGNKIDNIFQGFLTSGSQRVQYDCSNLANGIYFIRIYAGSKFTQTYKLIKE